VVVERILRVAAQVGSAALTGTVSDQGGSGVPGATVTITAAGPTTGPMEPTFRRNQFGGVLGARFDGTTPSSSSIIRGSDRGIGRTVISTVARLLRREGVFTEAIAAVCWKGGSKSST
jgi:hypothetical protein